jgi:hypothetical protein
MDDEFEKKCRVVRRALFLSDWTDYAEALIRIDKGEMVVLEVWHSLLCNPNDTLYEQAKLSQDRLTRFKIEGQRARWAHRWAAWRLNQDDRVIRYMHDIGAERALALTLNTADPMM